MSFISHKEAAAAAQLVAGLKGKREWQCPYILTCENATDDPQEAVLYLTDEGLGLGTHLRYRHTYDNTVICKQISPTRMAGSTTQWSVILTYSNPEYGTQEGTDPDGNPAEDPEEWAYDISCGVQYFQVPVWKAWNIDQMPKDGTTPGYTRAINSLGPIHNSAGIVYDPPLMRDIGEVVLRVSGNKSHFDPAWLTAYPAHINGMQHNWHQELGRYGWASTLPLPKYSILCSAVTADYRRDGSSSFWHVGCEFRIRDRTADGADSDINPQDGFLESILDRGITRIANAGAPDGAGGTLSITDIEVGMAEAAAIRDWQGERVPEQILLDGHGRPLQGSNTNQAPPVYFRWRIHPIADFWYPNIPLRIFKV